MAISSAVFEARLASTSSVSMARTISSRSLTEI